MKLYFSYLSTILLLSVVSALLIIPGCLKDHCTHTSRYKVYTPVYQPLSKIRKAVKAEEPRELRQTGKIYYHNGYLFLNEVNEGIHIIDNRDPSSPKNLAFINIPGNLDMAARGNILYADSYTDMVAIDISDPSHIKVTKRIKNVFAPRTYHYGFHDAPNGRGMVTGFQVKDTTVKSDCNIQLSRGGWFYDAVADMSFISEAAFSNKASIPFTLPVQGSVGGSMAKFTTLSHYLYTIKGSDSLSLYDISQASAPRLTDRIRIGMNIETIFPYKDYLFIGSTNGMYIFDAANPDAPTRKSRFMHFFACDPVVAQGDYAYVTLSAGTGCRGNTINELQIINISQIESPEMVTTLPLSGPKGLAVDGNRLFVCDPAAGIRCIDVSEKNTPKIITTVKGVEAFDAIALNGILIIVAENGLYQYDYQDLKHPKLLSKIGISSK